MPQDGGYTDKHKSEEKNHKRISYTGLTVIAAIVVIAVAIGVYFSSYLSPSLFSFFLFSGPSSFEGNHHSCMFQYSMRMLGDNDNDTFVSDVKRINV